jgi:hypothetical protein
MIGSECSKTIEYFAKEVKEMWNGKDYGNSKLDKSELSSYS